MENMKAGRAVIELLRAEQVEYLFGVTGLTTNSMVTETYGREDIKFIDTRHEEGAALMAYGYSKVTGKPSVCMTTSGAGTINLAGGISLAYKGRAPVVIISGDTAMEYIGRDGSQAFDLVNILKPLTKIAVQANTTNRVPSLIRDSFRTALSGKQGPVLLDIPRDLLDKEMISDEFLKPASYRSISRTQGDEGLIQLASQMLLNAKSPLLLAGGGVLDSEASKEAVALAELLDMALVPSYGHHDAIPNSHPNYVGPPGSRGSGEAHEAMNKADVILALGTRINQASTAWDYSIINPSTKIIQIDIDPIEIGRNYPVAIGIVGDAAAVGQQLIKHITSTAPEGNNLPEWKETFTNLAQSRLNRLKDEENISENPIMPQQVFPEFNKIFPEDAMITIDAGVAPGLSYDRLKFEHPRTMFNYVGQGALGMGYSVGLGTKLGRPSKTAISIHGDGGFLYTCGEINTAVRHNIPLVSIVLNNNCMGAEKSQQKSLHEEHYVGVNLTNPRFDKLAEVFGAKGFYIEKADQISDAVNEAIKSGMPSVIEIPVQEYFPPAAPTGL
ncbi:MAG: thiamine pyrophosphate-binding protein [SAR202 cluster bacterium]|jgi:thiamine pyrophosphate-dependent acetolactate synthase large subunit-like protein|nr:thiamine pyrophosphate-binding protein [Dehalococcoidia bacterium]MQG84769.1 thiamine pyrophosphate-binding protein [SAR202 cluster bacterium]|tara:strand:- start:433 stop:2103 length:1671 start_codon:yes stop_codon:yes gene_type:complete